MAVEELYELREFTDKTLAATNRTWLKQLEKSKGELFPPEYARIMTWASNHIDYTQGSEMAYGVFEKGKTHAEAIVEIVYTRQGNKWLKLLGLTLSPGLDLSFNSPELDTKKIGLVFSAAVMGVVRLTAVHKSRVTKLYGRSASMLSFLKGLASTFEDQHIDGLSVRIEGRWMVIRV